MKPRSRSIPIVAVALLIASVGSTGCASGYRAAYITGSVTKEFVSEAQAQYDAQANEKLKACDPEVSPGNGVTTKPEFDACMGAAFNADTQAKIVQALGVYRAAAQSATAALLAVDPDGKLDSSTKTELVKAARVSVDAALEALALFPEGAAMAARLNRLLP